MTCSSAKTSFGPVRARVAFHGSQHANRCIHLASSDDTAQVTLLQDPSPKDPPPPPPITHPTAVRAILPLPLSPLAEPYLLTGAGDIIRVYDLSSPTEPDLINEVDAHWHDVTALRFWVQEWKGEDGKPCAEPWIVSASLDGTIRKWRLSGASL
jgi:WD40 repeat protein